MGLATREQLREEDGAWVERLAADDLLVVLGSGPLEPGARSTAELLAQTLTPARPDDPEQALALLHAAAEGERLLAATAARWRGDELVIAWVGDVRGHLLRGELELASTREHTLAREHGLSGSSSGGLAAERIVTRTLGGPDPRPERERWSTRVGDRLLLCAPHLHDFRAPSRYLAAALDFSQWLPGRLLVES